MKNSIKERAKKVPKRIKLKVALIVWWLKLRQYFVMCRLFHRCKWEKTNIVHEYDHSKRLFKCKECGAYEYEPNGT